ncbi:MAG: MFS transporter [Chloroflexota bacterium]|nr:MFS transporter [Chloroflexota bacterium]MDE3192253.1 MFS transporter [Chloroflexota bacterium]
MTRRPDRAQLVFISATVFLSFIGFSILVPVLPFLAQEYVSGSDAIALVTGLLLSSYALFSFLAAPALGAVSDRWGRRPVLLVSLAGSVVGYLLLGIGGALWVLFLGRVIDGITGGNVSTAFAYMADVTEPADRPKYYGLLGAAAGLGFMFGPPIGGFAAAISISAPLFFAAAITLLNLAWGYLLLPESLAREHRVERLRASELNPLAQFARVFALPSLAPLFGTAFLFFVGFNAMEGNASVYLKDVFHWAARDIGTVLFVAGAFAAFTQGYLVRKLVPRLGADRVAMLGLAIGVAGLLLAALTAAVVSTPLLYAGAILFIVGDGLYEPSNNGLISGAAGPRMQGRVQGANQSMQSISRILGPLLANWVYVLGSALPWLTEAALVAAGLVVLAAALPSVRAAMARAA